MTRLDWLEACFLQGKFYIGRVIVDENTQKDPVLAEMQSVIRSYFAESNVMIEQTSDKPPEIKLVTGWVTHEGTLKRGIFFDTPYIFKQRYQLTLKPITDSSVEVSMDTIDFDDGGYSEKILTQKTRESWSVLVFNSISDRLAQERLERRSLLMKDDSNLSSEFLLKKKV